MATRFGLMLLKRNRRRTDYTGEVVQGVSCRAPRGAEIPSLEEESLEFSYEFLYSVFIRTVIKSTGNSRK